MYRHYDSSEDVFVDREEHIEWMNRALERCKSESVVNCAHLLSDIDSKNLLQKTMTKLNTLGIEVLPESEEWSEKEELEVNPPVVI